MNTIESISYIGLKNGNAEINFPSRLNAVVGPNRSGKTSIKDAVLLAVNGFHPSLGKTNPATMQLANGPDMAVDLLLSDGTAFFRSWKTNKKGTISLESNVPADIDTAGIVALNIGDFLAMKGTERLAFLSGLSDPDDLKKVLISSLPEGDLAIESLENCDDSHAVLAQLKTEAAEKRRAVKQESDRLKKALQEHLMGDRVAVPETTDSIDALKIKVKAAANEIAAKQSGIRKDTEQAAAMQKTLNAVENPDSVQEEIKELSAIVALPIESKIEREKELSGRAEKAKGDASAIFAFRQEIEGANNSILPSEAAGEMAKELDSLKSVAIHSDEYISELNEKLRPLNYQFSEIRAAVHLNETELNGFDEKTESVLSAECCPTCLSATSDFKAAFETARKKERKAIQERIEKDVSALTEIGQKIDKIADEKDCVEKDRTDREKFDSLESEIENDRLQRARIENLQAGLSALAVPLTLDERQEQMALIERIADFNRATKSLDEIGSRSDLDFSQNTIDELRRHAEIDQNEIGKIRETETRLENDLAAMLANAAFEREKLRLEEGIREIGVVAASSEKRCTDIKDATSNLLQAVWMPIKSVIDEIVSRVFGENVSARVLGTDIGLVDSAGYRPFQALSGSEKAVVAFGISIAIASRSPLSVAFIDELNRLDSDSREFFLRACGFLIAKDMIGQIVVLDHSSIGFKENDFSVITCPQG